MQDISGMTGQDDATLERAWNCELVLELELQETRLRDNLKLAWQLNCFIWKTPSIAISKAIGSDSAHPIHRRKTRDRKNQRVSSVDLAI